MGWSDLPADLASAIADRLTEAADLARFRSVCPSWRSASAAHAARRRVPRLLLPTQNYGTRVNRLVWSPADDSLVEIPFPAARGRSFLFASHRGWTLAASGDLSSVLVNPFTGASAGLPALPFSRTGAHYFFDDPVLRDLAWDWSPHGVVVVSSRDSAFFCRPGDTSWTPLSLSCSSSAGVSSVTYCDGAFYLFEEKGCKTTVVDAETLAVADVIEPPAFQMPNKWWDFNVNLVVSPVEFLLLVRTQLLYSSGLHCPGETFMAFRADRPVAGGGGNVVWSKVDGIGDRAVFVDRLRAFCVEANGLNGVRGNCMYVADSYGTYDEVFGTLELTGGQYTVSVLNLADLTIENLEYGSLWNAHCNTFWQWPSWLLPNPH